jgi:hypothetical protein
MLPHASSKKNKMPLSHPSLPPQPRASLLSEKTNNLDDVINKKEQLSKIVADLTSKYKYAKNLETSIEKVNTKLFDSVSKPLKSIDEKIVKPILPSSSSSSPETSLLPITLTSKLKTGKRGPASESQPISKDNDKFNTSTDEPYDSSFVNTPENESVNVSTSRKRLIPVLASKKKKIKKIRVPRYSYAYGVTSLPKNKDKNPIQHVMTFSGEKINLGYHYATTKNRKFHLTDGLRELLTSEEIPSSLEKEDQEEYINLLKSTGDLVPLDYYPSKFSRIKNTKKYMEIIGPALKENKDLASASLPSTHIGEGFLRHIKDRNLEYVYWDDPNELCERLKLLLGAQQNGNTNPELENEIYRIIEELREADIIY